MPNHVTNIITASKTVLDFMKGEPDDAGNQELFDFNTLIPMPPGLRVDAEGKATALAELLTEGIDLEVGPLEEEGDIHKMLHVMKTHNKLDLLKGGALQKFKTDESFENFIQILRNCRDHGFPTWYEWSIEHWGTKWSAYGFKEIEGAVQFDTAWSAPRPVIQKLVERFPNEKIIHRWADEDIGSNLGARTYENGEVVESDIADPVDFALMIRGRGREDYRENPETGMWEYHDEDEEAEAV